MIHYRLATLQDNKQLIELTAGSPMIGKTSLRIDRHPDFFGLLNMRGESRVFIAEEDNRIIGCVCVSLQKVYIGGEKFPVYYIGDFKVSPDYRSKGIGIQLCNNLADYLISINADLCFLTVAEGNRKPIPFFKNRTGVPDFINIGTFIIHQLIGAKRKLKSSEYQIEQSEATDEIVSFLSHHYRKYELGSIVTKESLKGTQIYVIQKNKMLLGVICLIDTMEVKQNVVIGLSLDLKILLKVINSFRRFTGLSKMPEFDKPVLMIYVKWMAVKNNDSDILKLLINHSRNLVYNKAYSFLSLGLHEKDELNKKLSGHIRLSFRANGMFLSIKNNQSILSKVSKGIPYEDYSLV